MQASRMSSRAWRMIECMRRARAEIDYAQRRMFELRTGVSFMTTQRARGRPRIEELEALYALEAREPDDMAAQSWRAR